MKKVLLPFIVVVLFVVCIYGISSLTQKTNPNKSATPMAMQGEYPVAQPPQNNDGTATYTDQSFKFSLSYPGMYRIGKFTEGAQTVFVLQSEQGAALQIVASTFDEPDMALTEARVREDIPTMPIKNARTVTLPQAQVPAFAFETTNDVFGESIEVWFVHQGTLYQASTYTNRAELMQSVLGTLKFN